MKVLLIQHQNHARRLFSHLLTKQDCVVSESSSFAAATGEFRRGPFDLVCIDEPMPDTKPLEDIRRLRSNEATADSIIIALVSRKQERELNSVVAAGADEYMTLPAPLEEVQLRLNVILGWVRRALNASASTHSKDQAKDRFFDSLPDAAVLLDRAGTVVAANERLASLTGYTVKQMIGQPAEFIGLPMAEEMPGLLEEAAAANDRLEDVTLVRRDMKPVPAVIRYAWLDPEVRSIVVGVARETGETGPIEVEPARSKRGKRSGPGFLEFDRQGVVRAMNRSLADALKTSRDQMIGTSLRGLIHREDLAGISRIMAPSHDGARAELTGRLRLRAADGEWISLDLVGRAQRPGQGDDRFRLEEAPDGKLALEDSYYGDSDGIDKLTGLTDRDKFIESVREALEHNSAGSPAIVLFLNLDRFKLINERYGYEVGDQFIVNFAKRLKELVTFADTVGRVGADEFVILTGVATSLTEAIELAEAIVADLSSRPISVDGKEHFITPGIGIALAEPGTINPAELVRQADSAAVQAKLEGRGKIQAYEPARERVASDNLNLEQDLLQALKRNELVIYYQPEVDLDTGAILGVEALVRWNHPTDGLIEPSQFIPAAETSGLIDTIGLDVLQRAAKDVSSWIARYGLRDFNLSVNYSAHQFLSDNLIMEISSALRRAGLPPSALRIEITESVLIDDQPEIIKRLAQIRKLGVNLAIDDFGTGRASMSYLRSLPVNFLKVDRTFVSGASAASGELSLTRSIASIAKEAGLSVVVEGIETLGQLIRVREFECRRGQGFYFSRPVTSDTIEFLLMAGPYPFRGLLNESDVNHASASKSASS